MFLRTVKMLKATNHAKIKKNQHRESLLVKVLILFYFYTATAVHEAGALAPANAHGVEPYCFIPRSASDTAPESYHKPF